jgi:hypothetical protein
VECQGEEEECHHGVVEWLQEVVVDLLEEEVVEEVQEVVGLQEEVVVVEEAVLKQVLKVVQKL